MNWSLKPSLPISILRFCLLKLNIFLFAKGFISLVSLIEVSNIPIVLWDHRVFLLEEHKKALDQQKWCYNYKPV
jgi:hypothetical protein